MKNIKKNFSLLESELEDERKNDGQLKEQTEIYENPSGNQQRDMYHLLNLSNNPSIIPPVLATSVKYQ